MSATYFEPKDVKTAKTKCTKEPWFKLDAAKTRKNKNKQQPTYYIPFTAKNAQGKRIPVSLRFARQVIASNAKIPFGVSDEEARDVRVSFRQLTQEDFEPTDYEESKREGLIQSNTEFVEALNTIADEYLEMVDREVLTYKGDKFKLNKNKTVNCFRQTHRDAGDDEEGDEDGKIALPHPIFRIKVPADPETKKLGFSSEKTGHVYVVFDMKKASKEAKTVDGKKKNKPVVAKIKTSKGYVDLTVNNAKHFITYMSLTGGMILFDSVCISKSGISLMCRFKELHVWRHRPLKVNAIDDDAVNDMAEYGASNGKDDDEEVFDEPEEDADGDDSDSGKGKAKGKSASAKGKPAAAKGKSTAKGKSSTGSKKSLSKALDNDEDDEVQADDVPDEDDAAGADEPEENDGDEDADNGDSADANAEADEDANEDDAGDAAEEPEVTEEPTNTKASKADKTSNQKPKTPPKLTKKQETEEEPTEDADSNEEANSTEEDASAKPAAKGKAATKETAKPATGGNLKAGARKKAT